jgi:outer membrane biosynthesis protein TonB
MSSSRRLLLALALSLGLHALAWLWLEVRRGVAPEPPAAAPIAVTFDFVEVEVDAPKLPPPPSPPPAPPPVAKKPRLRPSEPPPALPEPPAVTKAPVHEDVPREDSPRADVPAVDAPRGLLGGPSRLLPSADAVSSLGGVAVPDAGVALGPQESTPERVVAETFRDTIGRGKVDRGLVHPYFSELGKSLLSHWDAERAVSAKGLSGFLDQARGNGREWGRIWNERAAAYGASGSPLDAKAPESSDRLPPGGDPSLEARRALRRQMREEFRASRRATVRVVQDARGKLLSVDLVTPSNDLAVDREAIADIRAAAERLPPPPAEAMEGRTTVESLWQFELIISISPPVPTLSIEFDAEMKLTDARLPLDRRIYKRVRLLSVR